ncbi:MAG TPA: hypothetical protein VGP76_19130 [Planctomycetaceae bacterium]|jgi:hypothetical protein|nr:hypothetical protein [Planctomycetaceae bacterium]
MLDSMLYIVKALSTSGVITWVTPSEMDGIRSLSTRCRADIFPNAGDARGAIATMPPVFEAAGIEFSIERADGEAWD